MSLGIRLLIYSSSDFRNAIVVIATFFSAIVYVIIVREMMKKTTVAKGNGQVKSSLTSSTSSLSLVYVL